MIGVSSKGSFDKTEKFLKKILTGEFFANLDKHGRAGVRALADATPIDTGRAASSWIYKIVRTKTTVRIEWHNSDVENGANVAVLIQYGHGTRNGGYVQGIDYINPAMKPVFERIAEDIWRQVKA